MTERRAFGAPASRTAPPLSGWLWLVVLLGSTGLAVAVVLGGPIVAVVIVVGLALAYVTACMPGVLFATYLLSGIYKAAWQPYSPIDTTAILAGLCMLQVAPLVVEWSNGRRSRHGLSAGRAGRRPSDETDRGAWPGPAISRFGAYSRTGLGLMIAIGALFAAGVLYAPNQTIALGYLATFWGLSLVPAIPAAARVGARPAYLRQFLWTMFIFGIPMTIVGILQLSGTARLEVFGASTIEVGRTALLIPLLAGIWVLQKRGLLLRATTVVLILLALVVAIASGSRGPLLALGVLAAVAVLGYLAVPSRINWKVTGVLATVVVASAVAFGAVGAALPGLSLIRFSLFEDFIASLGSGAFDPSVGDTSTQERVLLFESAFKMFGDRPLIGFGTGGFEAASPPYTGPPFYAWPHNAILQFGAEFGVVGITLFLAVVAVALFRRFPPGSLGGPVKIVFAFFLLNAMVSDDIYGTRPMWCLMALVFLVSVPVAEQARSRVSARSASPGSPSPPDRSLQPVGRRA
jgi:O-antigen ligase